MNEAREAAKAILKGSDGLQDRLKQARAWLDKHLRSDPAFARKLIHALLPEAEQAGDSSGAAWLRFHLGWLAIDAEDHDSALDILESAESTFTDLTDLEGRSRCLNALGYVNLSLGFYDLALELFRESMTEAEKIDRKDLAGTASMNIAECLYELDDLNGAVQAIEQCWSDFTISPHNLCIAHYHTALIYRSLKRLQKAEQELSNAIRTAGSARHDSLQAQLTLAELYLDSARLDEAGALIETCLEDCSSAGERGMGARFLLTRARLSSLLGRRETIIPDIQAAIETAREISARQIEMDAEMALHCAWQEQGDYRQALAALVRHSQLKEAMKKELTSRRVAGLQDERSRREARHFESLYRQISAVSEIGQRITANLDLDATLGFLYGAINGLMDAPTLLIALVDEVHQCLEYRLIMVQGERKEPSSSPLSQKTLGCWCVEHRSDILIGNLEIEYRQYVNSYMELVVGGPVEKSLMFIPLLMGNRVVGVLSAQSHIVNAYDMRKVEILRAIGSYIAIAIENSKLFKQVQQLATVDGLTGLFNRRRLTEAIEETHLKSKRYGWIAGIIMVDVDHFKKVNDTYGHDVGDTVLRSIATILAGQIRGSDFLGRFGGEEFLILSTETGMEGIEVLAERLRQAIQELHIQLPEGGSLSVTASFGASILHPDDPNPEAALKRADQALYRAKESGRNRVILEPPGQMDSGIDVRVGFRQD